MRILLINQYLPPDPSPTAQLLGDVAESLRANGHETIFVGNASHYHGSKSLLGSRALREFIELGKLLFQGWRQPKCDRILFLSSPPFLPVIARMIRWRHRRSPLIHWAMDVYPDVAVALGETAPGSLIDRVTGSLMRGAYRSCRTIIPLDADMEDRLRVEGPSFTIQPPWPLLPPAEECGETPSRSGDHFRILYSGNLGRAHDWKTILDALKQLEDDRLDFEMVFQGGGAEREPAQDYADQLELRSCSWVPYVEPGELLNSLLSADLLLATQRPETIGCVWPSKLALSVLTGVPVLWIGPPKSAVGDWLAAEGHFAFPTGGADEVAMALKEIIPLREPRAEGKRSREEILEKAAELKRLGCREICREIEG